MTSSTVLWLVLRRDVTLREQLLLRESLGSGGLGSAALLARRIIMFTLIAEGIGAIILTVGFVGDIGLPRAVWWGVFHAISAFNNAGFDLVGGFRSLVPFNQQPQVLLPIAALIILGGISYTVVEDLRKRRPFVRLALDSKLVLVTTAVLLVAGFTAILLTERANPATLGDMSLGPRLLNATFSTVTPRSAGFNSIDMRDMTTSGLLAVMALMFLGGASGSTAGGIKAQTCSLLFFAIVSAVRGGSDVEAFGRRVAAPQVLRAIAVLLLGMAIVFTIAFALTLSERAPFMYVLFEAFSAFGTAGLSVGITPELSPGGRMILSLGMFAGRLGPLTLVLALAARERGRVIYRLPEEAIKIG
jgi:trk system potassium uptake protein TrkH